MNEFSNSSPNSSSGCGERERLRLRGAGAAAAAGAGRLRVFSCGWDVCGCGWERLREPVRGGSILAGRGRWLGRRLDTGWTGQQRLVRPWLGWAAGTGRA